MENFLDIFCVYIAIFYSIMIAPHAVVFVCRLKTPCLYSKSKTRSRMISILKTKTEKIRYIYKPMVASIYSTLLLISGGPLALSMHIAFKFYGANSPFSVLGIAVSCIILLASVGVAVLHFDLCYGMLIITDKYVYYSRLYTLYRVKRVPIEDVCSICNIGRGAQLCIGVTINGQHTVKYHCASHHYM